eukprot:2915495-Pleurochrysis_carterae.AAC.1
MAVERQQHRIRPERAGEKLGESCPTKPRSELNRICRERPELPRYAPRRPRDGWQWALEVPFQRETQPQPGPPPSQRVCEQRTRGRAGAHTGPEPVLVPRRNRHEKGKLDVAQQCCLQSCCCA